MTSFDEQDPLSAFESNNGEMHLDSAADAFATRILVSGETGVAFDSVALFAEPMLQLYDLDPLETTLIRRATSGWMGDHRL